MYENEYNRHCQLEENIMKNDTIIITNPNLTCLYIGQLISKNSLPKLLEENFVTENEIEFIPYNEQQHLSLIKKAKKIYKVLTTRDFLKIY